MLRSKSDYSKNMTTTYKNTEKMPNIYPERNMPDSILESKLYDTCNKVVKKKFGPSEDIERTKDELLKFKKNYNKKMKEMNILKIENNKLHVSFPLNY